MTHVIGILRSVTMAVALDLNFGQRPFKPNAVLIASVISFASALTNLADPTIADGSTAFDVILIRGNTCIRRGNQLEPLNFQPRFGMD